jgi:ferredoxin
MAISPIDKQIQEAANEIAVKKSILAIHAGREKQLLADRNAAIVALKRLYITVYSRCLNKPCQTCYAPLTNGFTFSGTDFSAVCSEACLLPSAKNSFIVIKNDYLPLVPIIASDVLIAGWTAVLKKGLGQ